MTSYSSDVIISDVIVFDVTLDDVILKEGYALSYRTCGVGEWDFRNIFAAKIL